MLEELVVHRDQCLGPHVACQERGLPLVEVADESAGLPVGVAAVDREYRDVHADLAEPFRHPLVEDRVPGVIQPHAVGFQNEAEVAHQAVGELRAEGVSVGDLHAVARGNGVDPDAVDLDRLAGLRSDHAVLRDAEVGHHRDDRPRNDDARAGARRRERGDADRVEVIDVLVRAEDQVDARRRFGREHRLEPAALVRREEGIEERGDARRAVEEPGLADPPERDLAGSRLDAGEAFHQRRVVHRSLLSFRRPSYEPGGDAPERSVPWNVRGRLSRPGW